MKSGYERIGRTVTVVAAKRSCLDKKPYGSKNRARDAAAKNRQRFPESLPQRPYRCTLCGEFHLTSVRPDLRIKPMTEAGPQPGKAEQSHQPSQKEGQATPAKP